MDLRIKQHGGSSVVKYVEISSRYLDSAMPEAQPALDFQLYKSMHSYFCVNQIALVSCSLPQRELRPFYLEKKNLVDTEPRAMHRLTSGHPSCTFWYVLHDSG